MASPSSGLSLAAREAAWARLWRALLAEPPAEHAPERPTTDDAPDRSEADEAA